MKHQMRRKNQEVTDPSMQKEVLDDAQACRLGFWDGVEPYVVPMNFGWEWRDETPVIYLHCAEAGRKIPLLKEEKSICFEAETALKLEQEKGICDWGMEYRSLIGWGIPRELTAPAEKSRALSLIVTKYGAPADTVFPEEALARTAVFELILTRFSVKRSS